MKIELHPFSVYLIVLIQHPSRIASRRFRFHLIFEATCSASCSFNQSFGVDSEWDVIKFLLFFLLRSGPMKAFNDCSVGR